MSKNVVCPLIESHSRLNQAYSIFSTISGNYQKPNEFTGDLNNLLQALRNVTFVLQAEKGKIPDFGTWYEPFQEEMKSDEVMRWLVDSRNHVVKRGDLEKRSLLTVRVRNHLEQTVASAYLDPFITLKEAADSFRSEIELGIPENYLDETVIEFERKWIVDSYPKAEILDVLIYCFSQMAKVVVFAHAECEVDFMECQKNIFLNDHEDFMIVLRNRVKDSRVLQMLYESGRHVGLEGTKASFTEKEMEEAIRTTAKKYKNREATLKLYNTSGENLPFSQLEYHTEMAKQLFNTDGFHQAIAFLYFPNRAPEIITFPMANPHERYLVPVKIAERVEATHCKALVFVAEMWIGEAPKENEVPMPVRKQKDKQEHLTIVAASPDKTVMRAISIKRIGKGKPVIGEVLYTDEMPMFFLTKVYEIWEYQVEHKGEVL